MNVVSSRGRSPVDNRTRGSIVGRFGTSRSTRSGVAAVGGRLHDLAMPLVHRTPMGGEANLLGWRKLSGGEERDFGGIIACLQCTANYNCAVQHDDAVLTRVVEVAVNAKQRSELNNQAGFFVNLPPCCVLYAVAVFDKPARNEPVTPPRSHFSPLQG